MLDRIIVVASSNSQNAKPSSYLLLVDPKKKKRYRRRNKTINVEINNGPELVNSVESSIILKMLQMVHAGLDRIAIADYQMNVVQNDKFDKHYLSVAT